MEFHPAGPLPGENKNIDKGCAAAMEDILKMESISKNFYGVYALKNVSFNVKKGEIHALVGENGAGKSTLMKVLSGVYPYGIYEGNIYIGNQECRFQNVRDAENAGISIIYQELNLVPEMDIGENIFLNRWPMRRGMIDYDSMYHKAEEICKELKIEENVRAKVKNLGIGMQQLVEIAKALSKKVDILVLDEPTASLTESEVDTLLCFLKELKKKGVTCIYISQAYFHIFCFYIDNRCYAVDIHQTGKPAAIQMLWKLGDRDTCLIPCTGSNISFGHGSDASPRLNGGQKPRVIFELFFCFGDLRF